MINYAPLCQKQADYIRRTLDCWLNVAEGGKRAGKNIINLMAWAACLEDHPDMLHLAAGVSISAAKLNIVDSNGFGLKYIFKGRCTPCMYEDRDALRIQTRTGIKYVLISGGGDKASVPKIKGNTYGSVYVTEANECYQGFIQEVFTRTLTSSDRKIFFDLNPMPPMHWFYRDILNFYDEEKAAGRLTGYNYEHFTVADNLSLSDEKLAALLRTYDKGSLWYMCDILGLRTSASGRIYTSYHPKDVAVTPEWIRKQKFMELTVGIDVGGTDATVATLTGVTHRFGTLVHIDGLYHKQGISDKMDEATYAKMVVEWLVPWAKTYPLLGTIYVDSANKMFKPALRKALAKRGLSRFTVKSFDKSDGILSRIELAASLLAQGRYKIADHMAKWHEAYQNATWDPKSYEEGEWIRTDDGSYPVDCLDSAEYSFYPLHRFLLDE